jgi:hypothetical protein
MEDVVAKASASRAYQIKASLHRVKPPVRRRLLLPGSVSLEKLRDALRDLAPRVELTPELIERARLPIERMLAIP